VDRLDVEDLARARSLGLASLLAPVVERHATHLALGAVGGTGETEEEATLHLLDRRRKSVAPAARVVVVGTGALAARLRAEIHVGQLRGVEAVLVGQTCVAGDLDLGD